MIIKSLNQQPYDLIFERMKEFTASRQQETEDELWLLEHTPVYTQGQAGKKEHLIHQGSIPLVQSDRGGQITYHGPGQLIAYVLFDIQRRHLGIRTLVCELEQVLITLLADHNIEASVQCGAPGVYVEGEKIASIGLRVKQGCTYHGIALNVAMDLSPFLGINPCGYAHLKMTQMQAYCPNIRLSDVHDSLRMKLLSQFGP